MKKTQTTKLTQTGSAGGTSGALLGRPKVAANAEADHNHYHQLDLLLPNGAPSHVKNRKRLDVRKRLRKVWKQLVGRTKKVRRYIEFACKLTPLIELLRKIYHELKS